LSSQCIFSVAARNGDWSRRTPATQASISDRAWLSGETLRMPQQASGSRFQLVAVAAGLLLEGDPPEDLDPDAVPLLELAPGGVRLVEQDAGVEREEARLGLDQEQHVHDHRGLLLEGARDGQPRVEPLDGVRQDLLGGGVLEIGGSGDGHVVS